jgi:hypothetical protein
MEISRINMVIMCITARIILVDHVILWAGMKPLSVDLILLRSGTAHITRRCG